ncbi:hypothetical protein [Curvivirga sp.]|uniref:hypothetical protein n=1 Tax=Curvivirga sp. TaxID=2856848 RepID=UPI003B5A34EE
MAVWGEPEGWLYEYFDLDEPVETFTGFEPMVDLYRSRLNGRLMPSWSDFDVFDFRGWLGKVNVIDVTQDPLDFKYRIHATEAVDLVKEDFTNKTHRELSDRNSLSEQDMEFYGMVVKERKIARSSGMFPYENIRKRKVTFLEFPLSDDGGETVTQQIEFFFIF